MADKPTFEELLFQGALTAVRTLTLDELCEHWEYLREMDFPDEISEFPKALLAIAIKEKELQRRLN